MSVRVLIVDDQEPFRAAARTVVELTDGFEVVGEAGSGETGVNAARELRPDLVLMDVNLPGIDGLEATRRILADSAGEIAVVMLSTYEADEYAPRAVQVGAAAYIPKSEFEPDRLTDTWSSVRGGAEST
jgi:DNA-binding NarL/FixJ family response regulator